MRTFTITSLLMGLMLAAHISPEAEAGSLGDLFTGNLLQGLSSQLVGLWHTGELEFEGHYCNYQVKPKFKRFELYFVGSMWCPGWTPIRGNSETRSRSGVVNDAVRDFAQKALNSGLITAEEARNWMN